MKRRAIFAAILMFPTVSSAQHILPTPQAPCKSLPVAAGVGIPAERRIVIINNVDLSGTRGWINNRGTVNWMTVTDRSITWSSSFTSLTLNGVATPIVSWRHIGERSIVVRFAYVQTNYVTASGQAPGTGGDAVTIVLNISGQNFGPYDVGGNANEPPPGP